MRNELNAAKAIKRATGYPARVVAYKNKANQSLIVSLYKGEVRLFVSVFNGLIYQDVFGGSSRGKMVEQFNVVLNQKQARELCEDLDLVLNRLKKGLKKK